MKLNSHIFISNKFKISYLKSREIFVRFNKFERPSPKLLAPSSPISFLLFVFKKIIELYEFKCDLMPKF